MLVAFLLAFNVLKCLFVLWHLRPVLQPRCHIKVRLYSHKKSHGLLIDSAGWVFLLNVLHDFVMQLDDDLLGVCSDLVTSPSEEQHVVAPAHDAKENLGKVDGPLLAMHHLQEEVRLVHDVRCVPVLHHVG